MAWVSHNSYLGNKEGVEGEEGRGERLERHRKEAVGGYERRGLRVFLCVGGGFRYGLCMQMEIWSVGEC